MNHSKRSRRSLSEKLSMLGSKPKEKVYNKDKGFSKEKGYNRAYQAGLTFND